ncbi:hypothetical protein BH09PLA1_BH09PLA1_09690 [soil metagenome]
MPRQFLRWVRAHRLRTLGLALAAMFAGANLLAFMQARSMTHFATGDRTAAPEQLGMAAKLRVLLTGVTVPRPVNREDPSDFGLAFETLHTRSTNNIDLEMWHIAAPMWYGPPLRPPTTVLLFHAYASSKEMMLPAARLLHDLGYDTLLVDFRGCGGSSGNETTVGYSEADDVIAATMFARDHFSTQRIVLLGDSMGAAAVLRAASLDPKLADALIVDAPFDRLLSTVENRFVAMKLPPFPLARLIVFWGGIRQGYWGFAHNPADYAGAIRCPVLHMHGENDSRVTQAQARSLFARFAGPKTSIVFVGAGHSSHVQTDLPAWTQAVRAFIDSMPDRDGAANGENLR